MASVQPQRPGKDFEPTLDAKGRINERMLMQYDGLYYKVQSRKIGLPSLYEEEKRQSQNTAELTLNYALKRAPQLCSRSTSPYLMANTFNFDVSDIMLEIKKKRDNRVFSKKYQGMTQEEIGEILLSDEKPTGPEYDIALKLLQVKMKEQSNKATFELKRRLKISMDTFSDTEAFQSPNPSPREEDRLERGQQL